MQFFTTLAALAAVATTAEAAKAYVYNHCSVPVYLWAVDVNRSPSTPTVLAAGQVWNEDYHTPSAGGVSIKLSKSNNPLKITQFEYTLNSAAIWYDGSNINCQGTDCPFDEDNLLLMASQTSCPQRACDKNSTICTGFYNQPDDNEATLSCQPSADTEMHLCLSDAQMPGGSVAATSIAAAQPAATQAAATQAAAVVAAAPAAAATALGSNALVATVSGVINEAIVARAIPRRHIHHALVHARAN